MLGYAEIRNLPRPICTIFFVAVVNRMGTMVVPFLSLYFSEHLHLNTSEIGLLLLCFGLGAFCASPVTGWLADHLGAVQLMRISLFSSAGFMLLIPWIRSYPLLAVVITLFAITNEAFRPAMLSALGDYVEPARRKLAHIFIRLGINIGMSMGPAIGGLLAKHYFSAIFMVNGAATMLAGLIVTLFLAVPDRAAQVHKPIPLRDLFGVLWGDRALRLYFFSFVPACIVFFQHESSLPLFMVENLKLPETSYGLIFTLNTILIVFMEIPLNMAMSHWDHLRSMRLGYLLNALGFGVLVFAENMYGIFAGLLIWTFGEMILLPAASAYVDSIAPPGRRGSYLGIFNMALGLGLVAGPPAGVALLHTYGPKVLWSVVFVVGIFPVIMLRGKRAPQVA